MTTKFIDALKALLTVTHAQASTFAGARAIYLMPVGLPAASLITRLL